MPSQVTAPRQSDALKLPVGLELIQAVTKLLAQLGIAEHNSDSVQTASINARLGKALKAIQGDVLSCTSVEYGDTRNNGTKQAAIKFELPLSTQQGARVLLQGLLGAEDSVTLMRDWGSRIDFDQMAPSQNEAILFNDSNSKARNREYAASDATTTQEEDLKAAGLGGFADDLQATIVCAALVRKAKDAGLILSEPADSWRKDQSEVVKKLSDQELDLLTKLRNGVVRTLSGALIVLDDGRLRALDFSAHAHSRNWAFGGAVSSAES